MTQPWLVVVPCDCRCSGQQGRHRHVFIVLGAGFAASLRAAYQGDALDHLLLGSESEGWRA